jgi:hypothetical protein
MPNDAPAAGSEIPNPFFLMIAWFGWIIGPATALSAIMVFLFWFYDYWFELRKIRNGVGAGDILIVFLIGFSVTIVTYRYWRKYVVTKKKVVTHLESRGFDCTSDRFSVRAIRGDVSLDIDFKSPFMDYLPGPSWKLDIEGSKRSVKKIGGFSPYYMRTFGHICVERRFGGPAEAQARVDSISGEMKRFFSERPVLAAALADSVDQSAQVQLRPSVHGERSDFCLNIGSWIGPSYIDVLD